MNQNSSCSSRLWFCAMLSVMRMNERRRQQLRRRIIRKRRILMINITAQMQMMNIVTSAALSSLNSSLLQTNTVFDTLIKRKPKRIWMKLRSTDFWYRVVPQMGDEEFLESFRMKRQTFDRLCEMLRAHLQPRETSLKARQPVSVEKQIGVALYKLASCAEYRVVGNVFGIHKSTVKKCLYNVVNAINRKAKDYIFMPNHIEANEIATQFEEVCKLPQVIGCIDGTHIPILAPSEGYRDFVNRKGWTSYNMQAVVDNKCRFRDVFVKFPGNTHDATVFKASSLFKRAEQIIPQITRDVNGKNIPFIILGDPAYPLMKWVMKDYCGTTTPEQESFNVYLNCGRVSVEMAFGRLKARWRILLKRIDIHHTFVPQVISACCVLHNFVEYNNEQFVTQWIKDVEEAEIIFPQPDGLRIRGKDDMSASDIRDHLAKYLGENFPLRKSYLHNVY